MGGPLDAEPWTYVSACRTSRFEVRGSRFEAEGMGRYSSAPLAHRCATAELPTPQTSKPQTSNLVPCLRGPQQPALLQRSGRGIREQDRGADRSGSRNATRIHVVGTAARLRPE